MPNNVKKYFWETEPKRLDPQKDLRYIVSRLLEYGDPQAIKWLTKHYTKKNIRTVAKKSRNISKRTKAFWANIKV